MSLSPEELLMTFTKGITLSELCFRKMGLSSSMKWTVVGDRDGKEGLGDSFVAEQA